MRVRSFRHCPRGLHLLPYRLDPHFGEQPLQARDDRAVHDLSQPGPVSANNESRSAVVTYNPRQALGHRLRDDLDVRASGPLRPNPDARRVLVIAGGS